MLLVAHRSLQLLNCTNIPPSPFSQRVWIALEAKGMAYQYCETDPFRRPAPAHLLEANPHSCVPAIRQGGWTCAESGVILEYVRRQLLRRDTMSNTLVA